MTDHAPEPLPAGLDPLAELVALADEASAILAAFSPPYISTRERLAFERRRAMILASLAEQYPQLAPAARHAAEDHRQAEADEMGDMMARLVQGEPLNPGAELARRCRNAEAEDPIPNAYARGRADWRAGTPSERLLVESPEYREGLADERAALVDAELLERAAEDSPTGT